MKISADTALEKLSSSNQLFLELFQHGTLSVEVYKPEKADHQQPHERDEIYVVISGHGKFSLSGQTTEFKAGEFIFVPARAEHRFIDFSEDFSAWVFFYGPLGGESAQAI